MGRRNIVISDKREKNCGKALLFPNKSQANVATICMEFTKLSCFILFFVKINGKNEQ